VPAIGWKVVHENQQGLKENINLQGLAIGNGLVEPLVQYGAYADYLANQSPPLVDDATYDSVTAFYTKTCAPAIAACQADARAAVQEFTALRRAGKAPAPLADPASCTHALNTCQGPIVNTLLDAASDIQGFDVNVYDIRIPCRGQLCYDFTAEETFMNLPDVVSSLGLSPGTTWTECDNLVHSYLTQDWMTNLEKNIPAMLDAGIRVLVYAGNKDFICNWEGNQRWVNSMKWSGAGAFAAAPTVAWSVDGAPAGAAKSAKGLTLLEVYDAGHMVPMDQPAAALDMLQRLMDNRPFDA
jgi:serine carboxypeptidase-like clade 4